MAQRDRTGVTDGPASRPREEAPSESRRIALLVKRGMDVVVALTALVLLSPLLAFIACAIALEDGRPILFTQRRTGRDERPFVLLKFRTMVDERLRPAKGSSRVTRVGLPLRLTGLDELPQLVNVLRGEMSLIGPRPLLERYLPHYRPHERIRHRMRPGITGLAQVEVRHGADWDHRLALDARYVGDWSLALDLRILLQTLRRLVDRRGALPDEAAVLPPLDAVRGARSSSEV